MGYIIPPGARVSVWRGKALVASGIAEGEHTINVQSTFDPIIPEVPGAKWVNAIGSTTGAVFGVKFSGKFKQQGFRQWSGTSPISMNLNIGFYTYYGNAFSEVYSPIMRLAKLPLPEEGAAGVLIAPGPTFKQLFYEKDGKKETKDPKKIKRVDLKKMDNITYEKITVRVGNFFRFDSCLIEQAQPTFSTDVDVTGYPLYGRINLTVSTMYSGYRKLLNKRG